MSMRCDKDWKYAKRQDGGQNFDFPKRQGHAAFN